ncbi:unnamed protein product, partial [Polarella glacialis]
MNAFERLIDRTLFAGLGGPEAEGNEVEASKSWALLQALLRQNGQARSYAQRLLLRKAAERPEAMRGQSFSERLQALLELWPPGEREALSDALHGGRSSPAAQAAAPHIAWSPSAGSQQGPASQSTGSSSAGSQQAPVSSNNTGCGSPATRGGGAVDRQLGPGFSTPPRRVTSGGTPDWGGNVLSESPAPPKDMYARRAEAPGTRFSQQLADSAVTVPMRGSQSAGALADSSSTQTFKSHVARGPDASCRQPIHCSSLDAWMKPTQAFNGMSSAQLQQMRRSQSLPPASLVKVLGPSKGGMLMGSFAGQPGAEGRAPWSPQPTNLVIDCGPSGSSEDDRATQAPLRLRQQQELRHQEQQRQQEQQSRLQQEKEEQLGLHEVQVARKQELRLQQQEQVRQQQEREQEQIWHQQKLQAVHRASDARTVLEPTPFCVNSSGSSGGGGAGSRRRPVSVPRQCQSLTAISNVQETSGSEEESELIGRLAAPGARKKHSRTPSLRRPAAAERPEKPDSHEVLVKDGGSAALAAAAERKAAAELAASVIAAGKSLRWSVLCAAARRGEASRLLAQLRAGTAAWRSASAATDRWQACAARSRGLQLRRFLGPLATVAAELSRRRSLAKRLQALAVAVQSRAVRHAAVALGRAGRVRRVLRSALAIPQRQGLRLGWQAWRGFSAGRMQESLHQTAVWRRFQDFGHRAWDMKRASELARWSSSMRVWAAEKAAQRTVERATERGVLRLEAAERTSSRRVAAAACFVTCLQRQLHRRLGAGLRAFQGLPVLKEACETLAARHFAWALDRCVHNRKARALFLMRGLSRAKQRAARAARDSQALLRARQRQLRRALQAWHLAL